ncbi:MAG: hypothetical protein PWP23_1651 [Candidatus Sumerlaeota bacterium]|nr:hypothetical protein [Candidatus Sumerlaeota bacterium]
MKCSWTLAGLAMLSVTAAHADVIFDNLSGANAGVGIYSQTLWAGEEFNVPAGSNYIIDSVTLKLSANSGASATAYLYEQATNLPNPAGTIKNLGSVTGFSGIGIPDDKVFTPPSQLIVDANTTYWVLLKADNANNVSWHYTGDAATTGVGDYDFFCESINSGASFGSPLPAFTTQFHMKVDGTVTALPVELDSFLID